MPTGLGMAFARGIATLACAALLALPASASAAHSVGAADQITAVRHAAANFVADELAGNGAGACALLTAPQRGIKDHRTCAQRWDAKLAELLHEPNGRAGLRNEAHAIASAVVTVQGNTASIDLPRALLGSDSRLLWVEDCWMLRG
jgi:hypothetical protein